MSEIRIGHKTQALAGVALLGGIAAAIVAQLPELKRYLKIERM
jgi:hypothetical protein